VLNGLAPDLPKEADEHRFSCVEFVGGLAIFGLLNYHQPYN